MTRFLRNMLFSGVPFGVLMTPLFWFLYGPTKAMMLGPASGLLFGVALSAFIERQNGILHNRFGDAIDGIPVLQKGLANHVLNRESRGGFLILQPHVLRFIAHGANVQNEPLDLFLETVENAVATRTIGLIPNGLQVERTDGSHETYVVWGNREWADAINAAATTRKVNSSA